MDAENREQEKKVVSTNEELGIKRVRTFAEDLAQAKAQAGVKEPKKKTGLFASKKQSDQSEVHEPTFDNLPPVGPSNAKTKTLDPVDVTPEAPKQTMPDRHHIEAELARSGIVTEEKIEEDTKKKGEESWLSPIRTLKNDAAESLEKTGGSQISMVAAEQNRRAQNNDFTAAVGSDSEAASIQKSLLYLVVSIVLVIGGAWGGYYFYKQSKIDRPAEVAKQATLLFVNKEIEADVGNNSTKELLGMLDESRRAVTGGVNTIVGINIEASTTFGTKRINAADFLDRIGAPGRLARSLKEDFVLGAHTGENRAPILLFKTEDFDTTFAAMLEWESSMSSTLSPLFGEFQTGAFEDVIIQNKDTRLLRDRSGETVLIYGFPNTDTIVISTNENTFFEVLKRLSTSGSSRN